MKIKKIVFSFYLFFNSFLLQTHLLSENNHSLNPVLNSNEEYSTTVRSHFSSSLNEYIKQHYNSLLYAERLSQSSDDILELLAITKNTPGLGEDRVLYAYTILKLMHDKIKSWKCKLIDDSVVHSLLSSLPSLINDYLKAITLPNIDFMKQTFDHKIISLCSNYSGTSFEDQQRTLKEIPNLFSKEYESYHSSFIDALDASYKLRGIVTRLTELMLSKITWSKSNYEGIWNSVIMISEDIRNLQAVGIIDDEDDVDSIYWSLTHGFCNYLDLVGALFPVEFYTEIQDDLDKGIVPFLEEEEQDEGITSKKETLLECLIYVQTKAQAYNQFGLPSELL